MGYASVINGIAILFIFATVLFLAYAASRYMGLKAGEMMKGKNIRLLESISIGMDKQLHLIKVGDKVILIATSGKNVQMLTEVKPEEMRETLIETTTDKGDFDFRGFFDKYVDIIQKKVNPKKSAKRGVDADSFDRISDSAKKTSDNLEKIRGINNKLKKTACAGGDENLYEKTNEDKN